MALIAPAYGTAQGFARSYELRVVTADESVVTRQILQSLQRRYPALQGSSDANALAARKGPAVYLALGPSALRAALSVELDAPIISLFTSSQAYAELVGRGPPNRQQVTAIYAEASPTQQMQLISRLFGRRVTVGVLITENTAYLQPLLRQAARNANLELDIERVQRDDSVVRALTRVSAAGALLAVPDSALYTPATLRNVLESTYRRNQPVVGFSTALVAAGTMATAYSTIDDVIAQLDEVLDATSAGRTPEPQFPRYWRVAINESVARSLNVIVNDNVRTLGERPPERPR